MNKKVFIFFSIIFLFSYASLRAMKKDATIEDKVESFFTQWTIGNYDEFNGYPFKQTYTNNKEYLKNLHTHLENSPAKNELAYFYTLDYQHRTGKKLSSNELILFKNSIKNLIKTIQIYSFIYPIPVIANYWYKMGDISKDVKKILQQKESQKTIAEYLIKRQTSNTTLLIILNSIQKNNAEAVEEELLKFREIIETLEKDKKITKNNTSTNIFTVEKKIKFNSLPNQKEFSFTKKNPDSPTDFTKLLYKNNVSSSSEEDDDDELSSSYNDTDYNDDDEEKVNNIIKQTLKIDINE